MSTTRSQLYRFARDLGNVEAVEHGYKRGGLSGGAEGAMDGRLGGSSTARAIVRSTGLFALSASDGDDADPRHPPSSHRTPPPRPSSTTMGMPCSSSRAHRLWRVLGGYRRRGGRYPPDLHHHQRPAAPADHLIHHGLSPARRGISLVGCLRCPSVVLTLQACVQGQREMGTTRGGSGKPPGQAPEKTGSSAVRQRTCFGSRRPRVQIPPPRPHSQ